MDDDDALLEPIRRAARRRETGPICALCRHVRLGEGDLMPLAPACGEEAVDAVIRSERCPQIGAFVTADHGHDCRHFQRGAFHA